MLVKAEVQHLTNSTWRPSHKYKVVESKGAALHTGTKLTAHEGLEATKNATAVAEMGI